MTATCIGPKCKRYQEIKGIGFGCWRETEPGDLWEWEWTEIGRLGKCPGAEIDVKLVEKTNK